MSLDIECEECDYAGKVSPAKAGKTIACPSCSASIVVAKRPSKSRGKTSPGRRPKSDNSTGLIALLGSTVLLGGILAMYWIKKQQLDDEANAGPVTTVEPDSLSGEGGVTIPSEKAAATTSAVDAPVGSSAAVEASAVPKTDQPGGNTASAVTNADEPDDIPPNLILPKPGAVKPEVALLAGISEVYVQLNPLVEDRRGAVQNAVQANCTSELSRCRLKSVDDDAKPKLVVDLDLRKVGGVQYLGMKAQLQANMYGVDVVAWENDAGLVRIDQKTLDSGIALQGLDREVSKFFVSLRDKIQTSKTTINSINEIRRREKKAEQDSVLNSEG